MAEPLISLRDLSVFYGARPALLDVSGAFYRGSLTAVAGPNGSGKSTLLKVLAGIIEPARGTVAFDGGVRPRMAYLPQSSTMRRDFPISVEDVVLTGFYPDIGEGRAMTAARRATAGDALRQVGLDGYARRPIEALSGGEFQRTLFARVIVQDAPVILLDEPFSAVDAETTARLIRLLLRWHEEGRTVVCVLHDLLLIHKYFPDSMVLQGRCLGSGHTHALFEQKLLSFDLDMAELFSSRDLSSVHHKDSHDD
ncbi:MAG: ABC transporter ATP-binding protein [Alphaproteobacteria bacterium]|nr:ABC transporter ATP-binding protein [Alphaproteobacteria bacterium]